MDKLAIVNTLSDRIEAADSLSDFLTFLGIDITDPNVVDTPNRVVKMYADELLAGYSMQPPNLTCFATPNVGVQQVNVTGIDVDSTCAHHLMPISGQAAISAFFLSDKDGNTHLPGLSKYARVVEYYSRRLQLQEALTHQIATHILENTHAVWIGVHIRAEHYCMKHRGVKLHNSNTTTTSFIRKKHIGESPYSQNKHEGFFVPFERSEELKRSFLDEVNAELRRS